MSYQWYPDGHGFTIKLYDDDGRMLPAQLSNWTSMDQLKSREDDVLICSYPRSGTHWVWEITRMLVTGTCELTSLDMKSHLLLVADFDYLNQITGRRVLATHRQFQDLPSDFITKKRKLVLVLRDPRDVAVSSFKHLKEDIVMGYEGNFDGFINLFLQGKVPMNSWARWVLSFEKGLKEHPDLSYHAVYYEKLKEDPVLEIKRLAEYLGTDPSLADSVAHTTQFSNMKQFKSQHDVEKFALLFRDKKANDHLFREGKSGGWKAMFSEEQLTHFNDYISKRLGRSSTQPLL